MDSSGMTEFDAAAGRRNPDFDTKSALDYVDLAKFVGEDGEPDPKAIKAGRGAPGSRARRRNPASTVALARRQPRAAT
jgi:hypothetical protein